MLVVWGIFMGVLNLPFKVVPIEKKDLLEINKILIKEIGSSQLPHLKECLRKGYAKKILEKNEIVAFCLLLEYTTHISLSYYYISEEYRRKPISLFFFIHIFSQISHKPIYVKKNKNFEQYKRYFKTTEKDGVIKFTNLRKDFEWVELLKQFQM